MGLIFSPYFVLVRPGMSVPRTVAASLVRQSVLAAIRKTLSLLDRRPWLTSDLRLSRVGDLHPIFGEIFLERGVERTRKR